MTRLAFVAFFASALGLLAAPTSSHEHGANDIQGATCPKFGCLGFLNDSFELPPLGYKKVYKCSNGHKFYVK
jgi:hypothetical protein